MRGELASTDFISWEKKLTDLASKNHIVGQIRNSWIPGPTRVENLPCCNQTFLIEFFDKEGSSWISKIWLKLIHNAGIVRNFWRHDIQSKTVLALIEWTVSYWISKAFACCVFEMYRKSKANYSWNSLLLLLFCVWERALNQKKRS